MLTWMLCLALCEVSVRSRRAKCGHGPSSLIRYVATAVVKRAKEYDRSTSVKRIATKGNLASYSS